MKPLVGRLVVTVLLFVGWLGYLGYLVATRPLTPSHQPLILSRPQFMNSQCDVVAQVDATGQAVEVVEVLWPPGGAAVKAGDRLRLADLERCRPLPRRSGEVTPPDFDAPGRFIIPLRRARGEKAGYEIAPIPDSPGFDARGLQRAGVPPLRIYRDTPEARAQYWQIRRPYE